MYHNDEFGESALARRHRRRKKIFGWVALIGLTASILGGAVSQIVN